MQLIHMEIAYTEVKAIKELTDEQYAALRERFVGSEDEKKFKEDRNEIYDYTEFKLIGTHDDLQFLADLNLKPRISRIRGMYVDALQTLGVPPAAGGTQIVNVVIPNAGLFSVRKLEVMEDCCTNSIQEMLDRGWRIVAVCPPNDTRRPTYILGHMETQP